MRQQFEFQLRIEGPEASRVFSIPVGTSTIGRQAGNDLRLNQPVVSRQHVRFDTTRSKCHITDLGSSNGTRVNGQTLEPHETIALDDNAVIKIGPFDLTLVQIPLVVENPDQPVSLPEDVEAASKPEPVSQRPLPVTSLPPVPAPSPEPTGGGPLPPGLSMTSRQLLSYLPGVYHTNFMARFLALFESILTPIEWNVSNFDLYLHAGTAPASFLPWLANWFGITFDATWSEAQRRTFLAEACQIYGRRGTRRALTRVLEIYTGHAPVIIDQGEKQNPFTFTVRLPARRRGGNREMVERIIDANKPAHTSYTLEFLS